MRGARVLARREADGYYYLGHIAQEVKVAIYWELWYLEDLCDFSLFFPCLTSALPLLWGSSLTQRAS